jgi:hypothetical protein
MRDKPMRGLFMDLDLDLDLDFLPWYQRGYWFTQGLV